MNHGNPNFKHVLYIKRYRERQTEGGRDRQRERESGERQRGDEREKKG